MSSCHLWDYVQISAADWWWNVVQEAPTNQQQLSQDQAFIAITFAQPSDWPKLTTGWDVGWEYTTTQRTPEHQSRRWSPARTPSLTVRDSPSWRGPKGALTTTRERVPPSREMAPDRSCSQGSPGQSPQHPDLPDPLLQGGAAPAERVSPGQGELGALRSGSTNKSREGSPTCEAPARPGAPSWSLSGACASPGPSCERGESSQGARTAPATPKLRRVKRA